jgi:hypothetical protein
VAGDALGEGRVAWVAWITPEAVAAANARDGCGDASTDGLLLHADAAPSAHYLQRLLDLRAQKTLVCPLEEVGIAAPYFSPEVARLLRGQPVIHMGDNKAANAGAYRGYSAAADLARVVSVMHARWASLGIDPWVEFVKSEANISDLPSRERYEELVAAGSVRVPFHFPPLDEP